MNRNLKITFAFVIAFSTTALAFVSLAPAQFGLHSTSPSKDFFRIKARYVVKDTGEVLQFDLVRPCRAVTVRDMYGDHVWKPQLPIELDSYFYDINPIFPKVTSDHHLVIMFIPNGCYERKGVKIRTDNGLAPKDLLPAVIWYDNPDEPRFGWEYATEDAYASPLARLAFEGATIEDANHADFVAWQKNAATDFRPSKVVKHPFGFTFAQEQGFEDAARTKRNNPIALNCAGVTRFKLLGATKDMATQAWPSNRPHFWTRQASEDDGKQESANDLFENVFGRGSLERTLFEDGLPRDLYAFQGNRVPPTRVGGGFERHDIHPPIVFPYIRDPFARPFNDESLASSELYFGVDVTPGMQGFLACFCRTQSPASDALFAQRKRIFWRASGEPIDGHRPTIGNDPAPQRFFGNDQYVYEYVQQ